MGVGVRGTPSTAEVSAHLPLLPPLRCIATTTQPVRHARQRQLTQPGAGRGGDEELGAVCGGARVGHGQQATLCVLQVKVLVRKCVACGGGSGEDGRGRVGAVVQPCSAGRQGKTAAHRAAARGDRAYSGRRRLAAATTTAKTQASKCLTVDGLAAGAVCILKIAALAHELHAKVTRAGVSLVCQLQATHTCKPTGVALQASRGATGSGALGSRHPAAGQRAGAHTWGMTRWNSEPL